MQHVTQHKQAVSSATLSGEFSCAAQPESLTGCTFIEVLHAVY